MKIGDLARRSGLSAHTLRYYERIGLLPYADRDRAGRRDYDASILTWIAFLGRLKATGMPISEMLRYATLRAQGTPTGPERRQVLERHREQVRHRIAEFQSCLLVLDSKIAGYAGAHTEMQDDADPTLTRPTLTRKPVRARAASPRRD
ncbi:MerR family transcriptional regulator [Methylobacterium sp. J-072]|uniref:MerR family transcriptional regulator n=1 Tax=Methylobacterium sp. J-072 TaxID=2836651 RepID=UPI001FBBD6EA|nr:MerR family transcriptional regulator [Methylobacterium sp. J-072]MCJ2093802.1 MerR family transcriptional regulator [Methylobacterium sp. J-072]